ncbi:MAG: RNase H family protein [Pseudanabaena sp.]|jgi:ribonuclease HI
MSSKANLVTIYVDGYYKEPCGGWGCILKYGETIKEFSGNIIESSKPRIDMIAVTEALKHLKRPCQVELYTNCQFLINCIQSHWKRKSNLDLWDNLDNAILAHDITWIWIKGYKEELHKQSHQLAMAAARNISPRLEVLESETNFTQARNDLQSLLKQLSKAEIIRDHENMSVALRTDNRILEFHSRKIMTISEIES